jgi:hypothetical protein
MTQQAHDQPPNKFLGIGGRHFGFSADVILASQVSDLVSSSSGKARRSVCGCAWSWLDSCVLVDSGTPLVLLDQCHAGSASRSSAGADIAG